MAGRPASRHWIWAAAAYAVLAIGLALWPFNFQPRCGDCPNGAEIAEGGLSFPSPGVVVDETAGPRLHESLVGADGITIVVDASPGRFFQQGPARIVSLSDGPGARNFTIGQERGSLVFRLRTPATGENGSKPATEAAWVMRPGLRRLFAAAYDGAAFRIHVDGALAGERRLAAGGFEDWGPDFTLIFGNETNGDRPWIGRIHEVAVYDRALPEAALAALKPGATPPLEGLVYRLSSRLAEDGALALPQTYANDHDWRALRPGPRAPSDYAVNAAFLFPLGALIALGCRGRTGLGALLAAAALAAALEWGQAPLFSRTSALADLVAGWAGLGLGWLAVWGGARLGLR